MGQVIPDSTTGGLDLEKGDWQSSALLYGAVRANGVRDLDDVQQGRSATASGSVMTSGLHTHQAGSAAGSSGAGSGRAGLGQPACQDSQPVAVEPAR